MLQCSYSSFLNVYCLCCCVMFFCVLVVVVTVLRLFLCLYALFSCISSLFVHTFSFFPLYILSGWQLRDHDWTCMSQLMIFDCVLFFVLCSYSSSPDLFCTYSAALSSRSISFPPSLGLADSGQGDYLPSAEIRHLRTRDLYLRPDIIIIISTFINRFIAESIIKI